MNYYNLLTAITEEAKKLPNIKTIILSDIYKLNSMPAAEFNVFGITPGKIYENYNLGIRYYQLNLYWIDRLKEDGAPEMSHSQAIEELSNIIKAVQDNSVATVEKEVVYTPFTMSFQQLTCGCYATVIFEVPLDDCFEEVD